MPRLLIAAILFACAGLVHADAIQQQHQGITLNANLKTTGEGWQQKPVLLMTHGTLAHGGMEIMATLQNLFAERGYSSLAITLGLGINDRHGMYDCNATHTHKHTDALDEIGLWRDWLKGQGVEKIVLLGHSRGGNQTAWFATERDDPSIQSVVLIAPPAWDTDKTAKDYKKRYKKVLAHVLNEAKTHVNERQPGFLMEPIGFVYCRDATATAEAVVSYYADDRRRHTPYLLESIAKPTLVFAGSEDTVVQGLPEAMAAAVQRDNVKLEVIEGADHYFRDLYAEDLADMAVAFIESQQ